MDAKIAGFYTCYDAYFCKIFTYLCKSSLERRFMRKIMNDKLTITTSNPVRARFYEYPRFTYPWHFHSEYEIIYVEKGEGDCLVGDSIISYSKGDLILFGSELPHSMQSPPDGGEESDNEEKSELKVRGVNIQFEKDFMHYSISQYSQFIPIRNLLEDACRGIKFTITRSGKIIKLLKQIPVFFKVSAESSRVHRCIRSNFIQTDRLGIMFIQIGNHFFHSFITHNRRRRSIMRSSQILPVITGSHHL